MKVTPNRLASICYMALAVMPAGMLVILLQEQSFVALWATRHTLMNPVAMVALSLGALALSAACFQNRSRSQRFKLNLFLVSLLLVALWVAAMPWIPLLPMLLYSMPPWYLWRFFRESNSSPAV
jgi:hypothetical protein